MAAPPNVIAYATRLSAKWDSIRVEQRQLMESLRENVRLIQGLPDDIVRDYVWPALHASLCSTPRNDDEARENVRLLLSLRSFNPKWRQLVTFNAMFGVLRMLLTEFREIQNPLADDDGMTFFHLRMDSFPNMHVLGCLQSDNLEEFCVKWNDWERLDRVYYYRILARLSDMAGLSADLASRSPSRRGSPRCAGFVREAAFQEAHLGNSRSPGVHLGEALQDGTRESAPRFSVRMHLGEPLFFLQSD
ncbi:unnamed protein product [Calypogeia fissa]